MRKDVTTSVIALIPYGWIIATVVVVAFYAFPQTDDFCMFGRLTKNSLGNPFLETFYLYFNWSGRFAAHFYTALGGWLVAVTPLPVQLVYACYLVTSIALLLLATLQASRAISGENRYNVYLGLTMFVGCLLLIPSRLEGVYWLTGVAVYTMSVVAFLLLIYQLAKESSYTAQHGVSRYSWQSMVLIPLCCGFNEFIGLLVGIHLILTVLVTARDHRFRAPNITYLIVYLISFAAAILAPGNFVRDATVTTERHALGNALVLSIESANSFVDSHVLPQLYTILALLLAACLSGFIVSDKTSRRSGRHLIPGLGSLLISLPVHLFTYSFLVGEHTPGRVLNQAYMLTIVGLYLIFGWIGMRFAPSAKEFLSERTVVALIAGIGVMLMGSENHKTLVNAAREFGPIWRYEQLARHERLKAAQRYVGVITLEPLTRELAMPPLLQGADISQDRENWVNRCLADYYDVGAVVLGGTQ